MGQQALSSTLAAGASLSASQFLQNGNFKFTMQNNCLAPVVNTTNNFVMSCSTNLQNPNQSNVRMFDGDLRNSDDPEWNHRPLYIEQYSVTGIHKCNTEPRQCRFASHQAR